MVDNFIHCEVVLLIKRKGKEKANTEMIVATHRLACGGFTK